MSSTLTSSSGPHASSASSSVGMVVAARQPDLAQRPVRQIGDPLRAAPPRRARSSSWKTITSPVAQSRTSSSTPSAPSVRARAEGRRRVLGLARARPAVPDDQRHLPRPSRLPHTKSVPPAKRRIKLVTMSPRATSVPGRGSCVALVAGGGPWEARRAARTSGVPGAGRPGARAGRRGLPHRRHRLRGRLPRSPAGLPGAAARRARAARAARQAAALPARPGAGRSSPTTCGARRASSRTTTSTTPSSLRSATRSALFDPSELWADARPRDARRDAPPASGGGAGRWPSFRRAAAISRRCWRWPRWRRWPRAEPEWQRAARSRSCSGPTRPSAFDEGSGMHRGGTAIDALESALGDWPAPVVVSRLDAALRRAAEAVRLGAAPPAGAASRRAGRWASSCSRTATRCSARSPAWPAPTCAPAASSSAATRTAADGRAGRRRSRAARPSSSRRPSPRRAAADYLRARAPVPAAGRLPGRDRQRRARSGGRLPRARGRARARTRPIPSC